MIFSSIGPLGYGVGRDLTCNGTHIQLSVSVIDLAVGTSA